MTEADVQAALGYLYSPIESITHTEIQGAAHAVAGPGPELFDDLVAELEHAREVARRVSHPRPDSRPARPHHDGAVDLTGVVRLSDVAPEPVRWMWRGRIPEGKLVILDGDPNVGKSTLCLDLAARVSTGREMPGEPEASKRSPRGVVVLTAEDGLADTVRPRLEAAGGDASKVVALQSVPDERTRTGVAMGRLPRIPKDLELLRQVIVREDAALVIVDPLNAYLDGSVDSYRDQDVRGALAPLSQLADETGAAIVVVRHLTKHGGTSALYRGGGSIGIIGAARSALLLAYDPGDDSRLVLAQSKSNLAEMPPALSLRRVDVPEHGCARIEWLGESELSADDLLAPRPAGGQDAAEWLREELSDGPVEGRELILRAYAEIGVARRTMFRAADKIGVIKTRISSPGGPSVWSLPEVVPHAAGTTDATRSTDGDRSGVVPSPRGTTPDPPEESGSARCPDCGGDSCEHTGRACAVLDLVGIDYEEEKERSQGRRARELPSNPGQAPRPGGAGPDG